MDAWIKEVLRLTFEDELGAGTYGEQRAQMLFNTLLHALPNTTDLTTTYNWFTNVVYPQAPQTPDDIVVAALDTVLADLGPMPWGTDQRGQIEFRHEVIAGVYAQAPFPQLDPVVHTMPFSSRSTFAHVVEYDAGGPVRIESMFALGQSGDIRIGAELVPGILYAPVYDPNFKSMTGVYDGFGHRPFPLNP
jgi:penicillin amidase